MKFVVSSTALLNVLQTSSKVVSNKNTLPILDNFLFDLKEGVLKITASDLETTLIGSLKVDNMEEEGLIAVPVKLMLDSLKEFSEQPLTIEANESTWEIQVSWKTGKLTIPGTSGLSYPNLPELNPESRRELDADADMLLTGINKTIFATADDELRPVMNGVYINIEPASITFVATDAHKLVKYSSEQPSELTAAFILPKKPATLLKNLLPKEQGDVQIDFDDRNAIFTLENYRMVCRLIEGRYPNYNSVIPQDNPHKVTIDRQMLISALRRVSVFSSQASSLIKLRLSENQIQISAQDIDFSTSAEETLICQYAGNAMSIGFKSTFLIDILNNLTAQEVIVELADPSRAGVIVPAEQEEKEDVLMLLMPMMLND